jgi:replicative DNA helicase
MSTPYSNFGFFKDGISRPRMAQIAEVFQSPILKNWAESDIYWEEIKSITPLEIEDVYDVTVENVHNFTSNMVILHNSIEQDADMVMALYRPEYYGFETDEEGNSTAGVAQVIILKQRNGPTGEAKMQFIGKYGKFADANAYGNTGLTIGSALNTNTPDTSVKSYFDGAGNTPNITIPSKMNEDLSGNTDDVPF